jgi:hypothetical protein
MEDDDAPNASRETHEDSLPPWMKCQLTPTAPLLPHGYPHKLKK